MALHEYDLAGREDRLLAHIIDSFFTTLFLILSSLLSRLLAMMGSMFVSLSLLLDVLGGIVSIAGLLFAIFYIFCADGLKGGQSYGKKIMGIYVIDTVSGKPCTFKKSFIRNLPLRFLGIIDWVFIFSDKRQRLGDRIAKTVVVRKKPRSSFS